MVLNSNNIVLRQTFYILFYNIIALEVKVNEIMEVMVEGMGVEPISKSTSMYMSTCIAYSNARSGKTICKLIPNYPQSAYPTESEVTFCSSTSCCSLMSPEDEHKYIPS